MSPKSTTKQASETVLARNVPVFRAQLRLTQSQLAAKAGISQSYVTKIETGAGNVTLEALDRIASALDTNAATMISPLTIASQSASRAA